MIIRLLAFFLLIATPLRAEIPIQEVTSPGGIKAWLVEDHAIPFTALEIRFRGGDSLDAPSKRGAVNLMTALLEEGAAEMDAQRFAAARDTLAAEFRFGSDNDTVSVSAKMLTENRDQAAELLRLALTRPRFDADAIERVRGQVLSNIRDDAVNPGAIAGKAFARLAFGDHPYGSDGSGTEESVRGLTRDDIVATHAGALARDRIYVSAVGDITGEELGALMDHLLGGLPETGAPMPGPAPVLLTGGVTVEEFPTPQSVVMFGQEGLERDDPDYFAAYVVNEILGGERFGSRLMKELREKRGLTYGVRSYLVDYDLADLVSGQFATANASAGQAVEILQAEWARIADGVTAEELATAKTYLTGAYPLRFEGNGPIARILVGMQLTGLPIDYARTRNDKIEAVTLEDAERIAKRLYRPDDLHIVVVGQPDGVTPTP